ncbi:branched-chain amino acid ABC transporter substrate-binding protein [Deferribacterales bacterium RsTz2092]|nr:branched-chain amino acid ABC transporter substrate-binding protein [Deferribacterales bacterium]
MKVKFLLAVFAVCAMLASVSCGKSKGDELVIGVQGPETGSIAIYGLSDLSGAQLAVDEINDKGGINGKKLKLVHYDSRGDKTEAVNVTQRLINNDKVCAILGEVTSGAMFAIGKIANDSGTVVLSAGATAEGVTDNMPFVFRDTLLDSDGAPQTIKFLTANKNWKNFAIITSVNNDYSVGLSKIFKESILSNGGSVVAEQSISDGDTNISAQITALKNKTFDAVVFSGYYQEAALILLELRKQGIKVPLVGGDGLQSAEVFNVAKTASFGSVFFAGFAPNADVPVIKEFISKMNKQKKTADMFSAQGYDGIYLFAEAMKKSGMNDCTSKEQRDKMRAELASTKDFQGVSGKMSFDEQGNARKVPFVQEFVDDGKGGYSWKLIN